MDVHISVYTGEIHVCVGYTGLQEFFTMPADSPRLDVMEKAKDALYGLRKADAVKQRLKS